jgi:hypothetical protein
MGILMPALARVRQIAFRMVCGHADLCQRLRGRAASFRR